MKLIPLAVAAFALTSACPVFAAGTAADNISASDPYVRQVPPGQTITAAFVVLKNSDGKDHKVVKAENPASKVTELHSHTMEGGMMKMRRLKDIEIKAKSETALQPGGLHIMMIDLKQPLKEGESIPLSLTFEDGSSKKIDAKVRKYQEEAPMPMDHDHSHMKH